MGLSALKLSPNYDTLSWAIEISFCGAHSMTSIDSITKPFIVLCVQGPTHPGQIYIHTVPQSNDQKMIIPLNDKFLNREMIAELSFKGLSQFDKKWSFELVDTLTTKKKQIINQDSLIVRPGFFGDKEIIRSAKKEAEYKYEQIEYSRLELHIKYGDVFS